MKLGSTWFSLLILITLLLFSEAGFARHISQQNSHGNQHHHSQRHQAVTENGKVGTVEETFSSAAAARGRGGERVEEAAGSRLPDCSHACGSCSPCRLVMISFICASIEEAETCPMAYRCMCNNKSYPVP